ncbi:hypothetical protein [Actinoplanes sp. NPDC051411]
MSTTQLVAATGFAFGAVGNTSRSFWTHNSYAAAAPSSTTHT